MTDLRYGETLVLECPPDERLAALLAGTLPEIEAVTLDDHFMECGDCRHRLDRLTDSPRLTAWLGDQTLYIGRKVASGLAAARRSGLVHRAINSSNLCLEVPSNGRTNLEPDLTKPCDQCETWSTPRGIVVGIPSSMASEQARGTPPDGPEALISRGAVLSRPCPGELSLPGNSMMAMRVGGISGFRLEKEIGRGGMGVVFRAWDETLARHVAVKVLSAAFDGCQVERFRGEARAAATVRSDHLVPVYSADQSADGRPFLVMPLIEGHTLRERLAAGPLPPREAARIVREVAIGLSALHAAGLLHRDIKPTNILLDALDGRAKLTDFGLARTPAASGVTRDRVVAGTPEYMAPEQATAPDALDVRADVYSLGVTLYECLTGTIPFRGSPLDIIRQRDESEPSPPRRLNSATPKDLETICLKAVAWERGRRYPTAGAFADDLARWATGRPITARPPGRLGRGVRWARRNPLPIVILLVGVAGAVVSTIGWWQAAKNARLAEERRESVERAVAAESLQRERAERHLGTARSAVDRFYLRVMEEGLLSDPKLQAQRREVLADAAAFYEQMLALEMTDPKLRRSAITTAYHLGLIFRDLGRNDEAEATVRRSILLAREVLEQDPDDGAAKQTLMKSLNTLRTLYWGSGKFADASALDGECLALCEELVLVYPDDPYVRRNLAAMTANRANAALVGGNTAGARVDLLAARSHFERLVSLRPDEPLFRADLARSEFNLGCATEDTEDQVRLWERSRELRRSLQDNPHLGHVRIEFAKNCLALAELRMTRREYAAARETAEEGAGVARRSLLGTTNVPTQQVLAALLTVQGDALVALGLPREAGPVYGDGWDQYQSLLAIDTPRFVEAAAAHARSHIRFLASEGRLTESGPIRARATKALDQAIMGTASDSTDRIRLAQLRKDIEETGR